MTRVLVVDDKAESLDYMRIFLSLHGFTVDLAHHGEEALSLARENPPDIAVSDLLMPVMDGFTLLRSWKSDPSFMHIPFIVYTATYGDPDDESLALSLGADAFILKQTEPEEFVSRIHEVLSRDSAALPLITAASEGELAQLKLYSETLIRRLEKKTLQLKEANRLLQSDIRERQRVEGALVESERRQRLMLESLGEGVHGLDAEGRIVFENSSALAMLGFSANEAIGQLSHALIHHHKADGSPYPDATCPIQTTLRDGQVRRVDDEVFFRRDGSSFPVEYSVSPVRDNRGAITGAVMSFRDVTESRAARTQLEASANLLRIAGTAARLGGWTITLPEWKLTWSDENSLIHDLPPGYQPTFEEAIGYYLPEDQGLVRSLTEACVRDGTPYEFELPKITAKGRRIWVRSVGEAVRDEDGTIIRLQGAFQDISERKEAEEKMRASDNELRALAESMPQMVWITDAEGTITYLNRRWIEYTGIPLEQTGDRGWVDAVHPEDQAGVAAAWEQATASSEDLMNECRFRRADGSYRWMLVRGVPFRGEGGQVVKWMGTCTDVHDLKEANTRLREQASLLDLAQDAIVVRDLEDRVVYWNRSAERLYGWFAEEALGRSVLDLGCSSSAEIVAGTEVVLEKGEWVGEIVQTTRSGKKITVEARWTLVRDDLNNPKAILSINTDITSRKLMESQFLRAQRLESIGTLAGGIAHDFNNLLAPIVMGVSYLKLVETKEDVLKVIRNIERSADRGKELVRQVLSFARGVEGAKVTLNLSHIVREVESIVTSTFPKNIRFERRIAGDLSLVEGDPTQIHQVLLNLCVNARDAMPDGGRLLISSSNIVIDEQFAVTRHGMAAGRYVVLEVADEGVGIPQSVQDRMFEPFFTTKAVGEGTGLGLSTVLGIVRSHGGFIDVDSEPGRGTRFRIFIPAIGETATREVEAPESLDLPTGEGELILVVDDEESILDITKQTLEAYGYRAMVAEDGAKAIQIYADHRDEIAAVITDIMMPIMNGVVLIAALRRMNPHVLVIAASGLEVETEGKRNGVPGVKAFLKKPFSARRLLTLLRLLLADSASVRGPQ